MENWLDLFPVAPNPTWSPSWKFQMTIYAEWIVWSTSCLVLGYGLQGQRIEWCFRSHPSWRPWHDLIEDIDKSRAMSRFARLLRLLIFSLMISVICKYSYLFCIHSVVLIWFNSSILAFISVVDLHRTQSLLGWVGQVNPTSAPQHNSRGVNTGISRNALPLYVVLYCKLSLAEGYRNGSRCHCMGHCGPGGTRVVVYCVD